MANQTVNPFEEEKPQIVHLEKSESHYEYCRMQMHEIEHVHRRTFVANFAVCIVVCILAVFRVYVGGFGILSGSHAAIDNFDNVSKFVQGGAFLADGIFQIIFGVVIIILGYLAWANFHSLNIILETWYAVVSLYGVFKGDYITAVLGAVGVVFYFFSLRAMGREQELSEMDGYPDFQEKFDISKSDIVIQTLLAHKGERRTKSTLFTTDYSLRRKKKKVTAEKETTSDAGTALAEELKKRLDEKQNLELNLPATESTDQPEHPEQPAKKKETVPASAEVEATLADAAKKAKAINEEAFSIKTENVSVQSGQAEKPKNKKRRPKK